MGCSSPKKIREAGGEHATCLNTSTLLCYFTSCRANSRLGPNILINCRNQYITFFVISECYLIHQNFAKINIKVYSGARTLSNYITVAISVYPCAKNIGILISCYIYPVNICELIRGTICRCCARGIDISIHEIVGFT